jgi:pilus assembly protein FimV
MSSDAMEGGVKEIDTSTNETMASPTPAVKKTSKSRKAKPSEEAMPAGDASGDHVTQSGDTLSKLAREMKPEGVSLEQMLVGLYQANPDAFQGGNMNRLKVGQIIRQPSEEELNSISRKEAVSEVKVQTADWNAYRNKLAGMVADAAPSETEVNTQSAGGKITSAAEDKSMPSAVGPKDVVKLSAGDAAAAKASAESIKSLQEKITALQEEATAREKSVKEAQDRTASLEKQIVDMQKLLALKSGAMSELQKQAEAQALADKAKPAPVAAPAESAPVPAEPVKPEVVAEKPKTQPTPEPIPEPSFFSGLFGDLDLSTLLPAGGLLAVLGGGWMYLRKKRERSLADFEQGIMTSGGLKANTVFGNTASTSVDTGDTSFLTDFSQSANGGMIDTNDVDPIAEAEVYMAYGRDAQAEEILKDAISKEPKRYELHLKLLEMYAASKNVSAFETISGELYTTLGAEDPTWAKVAEIGIKLEPNNPLYQANSTPTGSVVKSADSGDKPADLGGKLDANDFSDTPLASEKDLDFSLDNDLASAQGFAPTGTAKSGEGDLDLGNLEAEMPAEVPVTSSDSSLTFDMETSAEPVMEATSSADGGMDFDLGDLNAGNLSSTETKADEPAVAATQGFGNTMPSLDIATFQAPQFMPDGATDIAETVGEQADTLQESAEINLAAFEITKQKMEPEESGVLDISGMDTPLAEDGVDSDFNFAVHTIQPEVSDDLAEPNSFDLSAINLSLNDKADEITIADTTDNAVEDMPSEIALSAAEPIEVETKLELVVAYIEMDDKEGARELLDEIMKEGGAGQRKRAEELLAKLA